MCVLSSGNTFPLCQCVVVQSSFGTNRISRQIMDVGTEGTNRKTCIEWPAVVRKQSALSYVYSCQSCRIDFSSRQDDWYSSDFARLCSHPGPSRPSRGDSLNSFSDAKCFDVWREVFRRKIWLQALIKNLVIKSRCVRYYRPRGWPNKKARHLVSQRLFSSVYTCFFPAFDCKTACQAETKKKHIHTEMEKKNRPTVSFRNVEETFLALVNW